MDSAQPSQANLSFPLEERPRLRLVEAFPVDDRGSRAIVLRDPGDPEIAPIAVSDGAVEILRLLDGARTVGEIAASLDLRGASVARTHLQAFLEHLDEAGFLEGPRARHRQAERLRQFRERPLRQAVHAGGAYPDALSELPPYLAAGYLDPDGPGALPASRRADAEPLRAVIAPHVDLHRGAPTYSWAYKALAEAAPADLYLVLGTCHTPVDGEFAGTRKAYDTPLGPVPTDLPFLERVQRLWGRDLLEGEFSHAAEHSIEFQAVYLRSLGLAGDGAAPIVPILCGSLRSMVLEPYSPRDVALVADFVAALREAMREDGRRVTVIAAVDLAHVGQRFGDRWLTDQRRMERVGRDDQEMLDHVMAADPEAYYQQVMRDDDARRICGLTPIYLLTELMGAEGRRGELLRYTQWVAPDCTSSVTFASAIYR